jgi:hypothetical protein
MKHMRSTLLRAEPIGFDDDLSQTNHSATSFEK